MRILLSIAGVLLIAVILGDAFETIVLPRRVTRRIRLARLFFRSIWIPWSALVRRMASRRHQETYLSFYGPLALLLLLMLWATGLILGFALLLWAEGAAGKTPGQAVPFTTCFYLSGTTFFTLGLGDVSPHTTLGRASVAAEAGIGFGFLALVISYLPVLNQAFARREMTISLLDARAGSPPTAAEILRRHGHDPGFETLRQLLIEWERWSAELLESHLSYPVLAFFRSQHDNQSWLSALTTMLDLCALTIAGMEGVCVRQAELTFAMARHAVVDLSIVLRTPPRAPEPDRLPASRLVELRTLLAAAGVMLREGTNVDHRLAELRLLYEPYVESLARYLCIALPAWIPEGPRIDNWQTSAWELVSELRKGKPPGKSEDRHF